MPRFHRRRRSNSSETSSVLKYRSRRGYDRRDESSYSESRRERHRNTYRDRSLSSRRENYRSRRQHGHDKSLDSYTVSSFILL